MPGFGAQSREQASLAARSQGTIMWIGALLPAPERRHIEARPLGAFDRHMGRAFWDTQLRGPAIAEARVSHGRRVVPARPA